MTRAILPLMPPRIEISRAELERALSGATLGEAAAALQVSRWTLGRLLDEHGLSVPTQRGRPPTLPDDLGGRVYELVERGQSLREAAEAIGVTRNAAHRHVLDHAARCGLAWPPPPIGPPSEGERCYRARLRGLSWDQVAREELAPLDGRTSPEHLAMTVAKRWAKASGASWPVKPPKS